MKNLYLKKKTGNHYKQTNKQKQKTKTKLQWIIMQKSKERERTAPRELSTHNSFTQTSREQEMGTKKDSKSLEIRKSAMRG